MTRVKINQQRMNVSAEMLRALAHPLRLSIVALLDEEGALTVTEIHEALGIEQAVASHHLGIMKTKGMLNVERDGRNCRYSLRFGCLTMVLSCMELCQKKNS